MRRKSTKEATAARTARQSLPILRERTAATDERRNNGVLRTLSASLKERRNVMRLYANEKEAQALQIALALLAAQGNEHSDVAQALLTRIAQCLELQGKAKN